MSTQKFSTRNEARESIATAIEAGDASRDEYDLDAICDQTVQWRADVDEAGVQHGNGWFEQTVDADQFWTVVEAHAKAGE